jgi:hypothetical protein
MFDHAIAADQRAAFRMRWRIHREVIPFAVVGQTPSNDSVGLSFPEQFRQPRDVDGTPPRLFGR